MADHKLLRLSATLMFIGLLVFEGVSLLHPPGANDHQAAFTAYANSSSWAAVHLSQFVCIAVLLAGLLVLFFALNVSEGTPRWLGFFGAVATGVTLVLFAIVIVWTARVPRPIGYLMGLSGLAWLVLGWVFGVGGFAPMGEMPSDAAQAFLLASIIWLLIVAWRRKESVQAAPA